MQLRLLPAPERIDLVRAGRQRHLRVSDGPGERLAVPRRHVQRRIGEHVVLGLPGGDVERGGGEGVSNVPRSHLLQRRLGQVLFLHCGPVLVRWRPVMRRLRRGYVFKAGQLDVHAMLERYLRSN